MKKAALITIVIMLVFILPAQCKPKKKTYDNSPEQVFTAALRTARERHVITYVDEKQLMFAFTTGRSFTSNGFSANASVEPEGAGKATLIINVQNKQGLSWGAGDRMADKFYEQVAQELSGEVAQKSAVRPAQGKIAVPEAKGEPTEPSIAKVTTSGTASSNADKGTVMLTSMPEGADVFVDDAFVGNAPASLRLAGGKHTVKVAHTGYKAWTKELVVMTDSEVRLKATLDKD